MIYSITGGKFMAGTFSQIYIQIVFAVQGRQNLLQKEWRDEVFKYMAGIIKNKGQKPIIVNGVEDHAHVFVGLKPAMALSDLVRDIKNNSSNFIMIMLGSKESLVGKKATARSLTVIHRSRMYITIF
jgi:REP element-mobilizing transposase RayT